VFCVFIFFYFFLFFFMNSKLILPIAGGLAACGGIGVAVMHVVKKRGRSGRSQNTDSSAAFSGHGSGEHQHHQENINDALAHTKFVHGDTTLWIILDNMSRFAYLDPEAFRAAVNNADNLLGLFAKVSMAQFPVTMGDSVRGYKFLTAAHEGSMAIRDSLRQRHSGGGRPAGSGGSAAAMMQSLTQNIKEFRQKLDDIAHNVRLTVDERTEEASRKGNLV
jgi:hypothetical protein